MKKRLLLLGIVGLLCGGCQVIPTDMFPKFTWYWSKDAKQYRQDRDAGNPEKHQ